MKIYDIYFYFRNYFQRKLGDAIKNIDSRILNHSYYAATLLATAAYKT